MKRIWIIIITIVATAGLVGGGTYFYLNEKADSDNKALQAQIDDLNAKITTADHVAQNDETTMWKTYTNNKYGFSFKYPPTWTEETDALKNATARGEGGNNLLFKVAFNDPETESQIACVNNKFDNWKDKTPTKADCEPILAKMTQAEQDAIAGPTSPKGIFVRINKTTSAGISDWLIGQFKVTNTELEGYAPGKKITMANISGLASQVGCCTAYDFSYVVKNDSYVYSLGTMNRTSNIGTNGKTGADQDNSIVSAIAKTFTLDTLVTTMTWKTYTNSRVGYSFEYPSTGLTLDLDETIKYPSTRVGDSKYEDLVQFANSDTTYSVQTDISGKERTVEAWITDGTVGTSLSDFTKTSVDGVTAYTKKSDLRTFVVANQKFYTIIARNGIAAKTGADENYAHLLSSFKFTK
jgi:hypothetical protein